LSISYATQHLQAEPQLDDKVKLQVKPVASAAKNSMSSSSFMDTLRNPRNQLDTTQSILLSES
jgi:hypothetical protein